MDPEIVHTLCKSRMDNHVAVRRWDVPKGNSGGFEGQTSESAIVQRPHKGRWNYRCGGNGEDKEAKTTIGEAHGCAGIVFVALPALVGMSL